MSFFVALDLPPHVKAVIAQKTADFHTTRASWVRPEKLHVTLVFLGNPVVAPAAAQLEAIAARHHPFQLQLQAAGTFETARAASVLWLGVGGALDALQALHATAAEVLAPFQRDAGPPLAHYVPHVTLARAKVADAFSASLAALQHQHTEPFLIDAITLFESRHDRYQALLTVPLTAR